MPLLNIVNICIYDMNIRNTKEYKYYQEKVKMFVSAKLYGEQ